ncbi:transposase, partial [Parafrankia sp. FMc2]|uniref:IS701 family transposase n=1 Tax=Parafrankia sp. FMc2 TaxID=3233196 RepID=UPI0034D4B012
TATAHVGRQWLGRYGKTDNAVVTVSTLWADERVYSPLHARPYTPAQHFPTGKSDPGFRTKPQIAVDLVRRAAVAGVVFRAVVADCAYGDHDAFRGELFAADLPFVMALKPHRGTWAYGPDAHTPLDAARGLSWNGPRRPGPWKAIRRTFRDGHTATWWAAEARLGCWGPDGVIRLVIATTDPARLPATSTWYLATNLPRPGSTREADSPHPAADLTELVRIYGIRNWIEQSYKQVKDELGWADFQVRSDLAIRRHQTLVFCAFSFCWASTHALEKPPGQEDAGGGHDRRERGCDSSLSTDTAALAGDTARGPRLADPLDHAAALLARMVSETTAR